jgi:hypothetical protein
MFSVITPLALGWIAGTALQLQQGQLWAGEVYRGLAVAALMWAFIATRIDISCFAWVRSASALLSRASAGAGV